MIALSEPLGPGRVLRWPVAETTDFLLERAREALLRRRWSIQPECTCSTCEAARAKPYRCEDCGFTGVPATIRCGCHTELAGHLSFNRVTLRQYTEATWPQDWKTSRQELVRQTAQLRRLQRQAQTIAACTGNGRGMPVSDAHPFEGNCCHGMLECPACGGYGDVRRDDATHALAICRELNAIFFPAGAATEPDGHPLERAALPLLLAPRIPFAHPPVAIVPEEEHGEGYVARGLKSELPLDGLDAGPLELVVAEDLYRAERDHASPRQVFVQMSGDEIGGDPAIGIFLTARDLDATIQQLIVLRDRAHAEGFFDQAKLAAGAVA